MPTALPPPALSAPVAFVSHARPLLMAHRGAPRERPENTLASFAAAVDAGADVLELDVRETSDGEWVVSHDNDLAHLTGARCDIARTPARAICALTLREPVDGGVGKNPAHVPRLFDVLVAFPGASFNVDIKDAPGQRAETVLDVVRRAKVQAQRPIDILLTSSRRDTQDALRAATRGEVALGMGKGEVLRVLMGAYLGLEPPRHLRGLAFQAPLRNTWVGISFPIVTDRVIRYVKQMGSPIHVWGEDDRMIDSPEQARALFDRGIDGIFTDRIREMVAALRPAV